MKFPCKITPFECPDAYKCYRFSESYGSKETRVIKIWFKGSRNFVFNLDSNRTLIWHCLVFLLDFQNAKYSLDVCGIECCLWNYRFLQRGCWEVGENWQVFCKLCQSSIVAKTFEYNLQICRLRLLHVDDLIRWLYDDHWLKVVGDVPARNYDKQVILSIHFQKQ